MSRFVAVAFVLVGVSACGGVVDPDSEYAERQSELRSRPSDSCSDVYEPVCGKDGMNYLNTCYAGGKRNVAYSGECFDACATTYCSSPYVCEVNRRGEPMCVLP